MSVSKLKSESFAKKYEDFLCANTQGFNLLEWCLKLSSFLVNGNVRNGYIISEAIYSFSNLFSLLNDVIISRKLIKTPNNREHKIKLWLTILHHSEIGFEVLIGFLYGYRFKWFSIYVIEILKFAFRLILLYKHKNYVIQSPPIKNIDRELFSAEEKAITKNTFFLESTGREIKHIATFQSLDSPLQPNFTTNFQLGLNMIFAETVYITKPIVHLLLRLKYGCSNWTIWCATALMELTSLKISSKSLDILNTNEKVEVFKRHINLLMYVLRPPFYEKYSRRFILKTLSVVSKFYVLSALMLSFHKSFPEWQATYFNIWAQ